MPDMLSSGGSGAMRFPWRRTAVFRQGGARCGASGHGAGVRDRTGPDGVEPGGAGLSGTERVEPGGAVLS
ncbi:hypothetical protein GCM10010499_36150 [Streptomyces thermoviolaceus subsp. apingens]|nr:hypothetical protein GCM10010499_36150 [Streptomyces thermoviolaceus subsp. apingens]